MKIYKDPLIKNGNSMPNGGHLMTYKAPAFMDCGYIYSPYVPLNSDPKHDIEEFVPEASKKVDIYRSIDEPWEITQND